MQGLHLTHDLTGCDPARPVMTDPSALRTLCLAVVAQAGLQAVGELFHRFAPVPDTDPALAGVTGMVLLAESHLAVHTWPEQQGVTLDVYVCNRGQDNSGRARAVMRQLSAAFGATGVLAQQLHRGGPGPGSSQTRAPVASRRP